MKRLTRPEIDKHRLRINIEAVETEEKAGAFQLRSESTGEWLRIIASAGRGWDHVSVSCEYRTPTWAEMEQVKRLFFGSRETVMQLHVPPAEHINCHPYTLHLWRPHRAAIPRPPQWMV